MEHNPLGGAWGVLGGPGESLREPYRGPWRSLDRGPWRIARGVLGSAWGAPWVSLGIHGVSSGVLAGGLGGSWEIHGGSLGVRGRFEQHKKPLLFVLFPA